MNERLEEMELMNHGELAALCATAEFALADFKDQRRQLRDILLDLLDKRDGSEERARAYLRQTKRFLDRAVEGRA